MNAPSGDGRAADSACEIKDEVAVRGIFSGIRNIFLCSDTVPALTEICSSHGRNPSFLIVMVYTPVVRVGRSAPEPRNEVSFSSLSFKNTLMPVWFVFMKIPPVGMSDCVFESNEYPNE